MYNVITSKADMRAMVESAKQDFIENGGIIKRINNVGGKPNNTWKYARARNSKHQGNRAETSFRSFLYKCNDRLLVGKDC